MNRLAAAKSIRNGPLLKLFDSTEGHWRPKHWKKDQENTVFWIPNRFEVAILFGESIFSEQKDPLADYEPTLIMFFRGEFEPLKASSMIQPTWKQVLGFIKRNYSR